MQHSLCKSNAGYATQIGTGVLPVSQPGASEPSGYRKTCEWGGV